MKTQTCNQRKESYQAFTQSQNNSLNRSKFKHWSFFKTVSLKPQWSWDPRFRQYSLMTLIIQGNKFLKINHHKKVKTNHLQQDLIKERTLLEI
jgi:hypothetical protein